MRIAVLVTALVGLYGLMGYYILENPRSFCIEQENVSFDSCVVNFR